MIYAFDPKKGWQCPRCGKGKLLVSFAGDRSTECHLCPKCAFFETLFRNRM